MIDVRVRSTISDDELAGKMGKVLTEADLNILVTGDTLVRKPNGQPLAIYIREAIRPETREEAYPILHPFKDAMTTNRGATSGSRRVPGGSGKRSYSRPIPSAIVGAFDPVGPQQYCRLTSFTGREPDKMAALHPLLREVGDHFRRLVSDRWRVQMDHVRRTDPAWLIPDTPFTTVTINNTYPTAVHTDKGDLEAGFSNLTVLRRGEYEGGNLTFPRYRVGVNMRDGDLLLMDAHEPHGNTPIVCEHGPLKQGPCPQCGG